MATQFPFQEMMKINASESLGKKVIVITGATSGIGRAVALNLGRFGARLILVGRNEKQGNQLVKRICCDSQGSQAEFYQTDLSNLTEVRRLVSKLRDHYYQVDILINNAGARFNNFEKTSEGFERTFATNYLGHFLLTVYLLEPLLQAPAARIITIGSGAHFNVNEPPQWTLTDGAYERKLAYARSKLANIMFAYELAHRLSGTTVTSNAVDPGDVATNLGRNNGLVAWLRHLVYYILKRQLVTAHHAAKDVVYLALAEELEGVTGRYFNQCKPVASSMISQDIPTARKLWSLSMKLTGIDASLGKVWEYVRPQDCP
jgi:NAD(P)-dependent dehydrogenase (short-subunit alcohol dehydrogenase family)